MTTTIDCDDCVMQGTTACDDCLVTFICGPTEAPVVLAGEEERGLRLLARSGLVPGLRHASRGAARCRAPSPAG